MIEDGKKIYQHVAEVVEGLADQTCEGDPFGVVGAVVGATYPRELVELREAMPHTSFLIPGYGNQGGRGSTWRLGSPVKDLVRW